MIDYQTFHQIKELQGQGLKAGQIAARLRVDAKTVRKWWKRDRYAARHAGARRPQAIESWRAPIHVLLRECETYGATQIWQKLQDQGYKGGYTVIREYVRSVRPSAPRPYQEPVFAAGEAAQVDFGCCGSIAVGETTRKLSVFVMTLCYSRLMYVELVLSQAMEQFLSCHRNAFEYFGGVPGAVIVDRCKTAIVGETADGRPIPHPRYQDMARHCGFEVRACARRSPWQKGRVERGVGYVKHNFLHGRARPGLETLRVDAHDWLERVANVRVHGTTGEKPAVLFAKEKPCLKPLPANPYDCSVTKSCLVDKTCRFRFDGNRYSVPPLYASAKVTVHILPDRLLVYARGQFIARHDRCYGRRQPVVDPEHDRQVRLEAGHRRERRLLQDFLAIGEVAERFYHGLTARQVQPRSHVRKVLALREIHGTDKVRAALEDAVRFHAFAAEYIEHMVRFRVTSEEPPPLRLARRQDLLELDLKDPSLAAYQERLGPNHLEEPADEDEHRPDDAKP